MAFLQKKGVHYYIVDKSGGKPKWLKIGAIRLAEAKQVLARYSHEQTYLRLDLQGDSDLTFKELTSEYASQIIKAPKTVKTEKDHLNMFCNTFGDRRFHTITAAEYEAVYRAKSPNYCRLLVATLRNLYKYAVARRYVRKNIALDLQKPALQILPPKHVDTEEIQKVFLHMTPPVRDKFKILYYTGLRPAELLRLQVKDISISGKTLTVRYSKTKRFRMIPLHSQILPILETLLNDRKPEDFLFRSNHGKKHQIQLHKGLKRACERAGVTGVTPYNFRHTFATQFLKATKNIRALQQILGHSTIQMTTRYATVLDPELQEGIDALV